MRKKRRMFSDNGQPLFLGEYLELQHACENEPERIQCPLAERVLLCQLNTVVS